jgi:hypothetical protein
VPPRWAAAASRAGVLQLLAEVVRAAGVGVAEGQGGQAAGGVLEIPVQGRGFIIPFAEGAAQAADGLLAAGNGALPGQHLGVHLVRGRPGRLRH